MSETLDTITTSKRPTFLTVLCILTFIGSGLGVLGGILGLVGSSALASFAPAAGGSVIWAIISLAGSALCLFGAIQMWGLKKSGFTLYLLGSLIAVAVSIINAATASVVVSEIGAMGPNNDYNALAGAANAVMWTSVIIGIIITIVFVLMYNANRRHLVK
ncbi:hypothetical protein [Fluviicola sp.]|uniref:hypothetical protein n=1 Tax=Fluviicola sp. TaxID=1917219 RepID=UPI00282476C8|nr:hypothetical protein [Fluviicola sp.]MDR0802585.1 hypothetical protein [Fluviicola sp.]